MIARLAHGEATVRKLAGAGGEPERHGVAPGLGAIGGKGDQSTAFGDVDDA